MSYSDRLTPMGADAMHMIMTEEKQIHDKIAQIASLLKEHYASVEDIGVLSGLSGIALFMFYHSRWAEDESSADVGVEILTEVIDKINNSYNFPTYCTGIAGAGWAIELLSEEGFVELDCDALLSPLDDFLEDSMEIDDQDNFYDFLHGVLGIGYFFYKRFRNTKSDDLRIKYLEILRKVLLRLHRTAIEGDNSVKWESYLIRSEGLRGYNLGLAHGISSIINFLSRLVEHPELEGLAGSLLRKSVNFVITSEQNESQKGEFFPDWFTTENEIGRGGRLAWCYGDLGITYSLMRSAKTLQDYALTKRSIKILTSISERRSEQDTKVQDAGFCHGSAGIMHMYNSLYRATGSSDFQDTSDHWMRQTLLQAHHHAGYAGYMQKRGDVEDGWSAELNLLEGIAGIGLSLIAYLSPELSSWDQALLIG